MEKCNWKFESEVAFIFLYFGNFFLCCDLYSFVVKPIFAIGKAYVRLSVCQWRRDLIIASFLLFTLTRCFNDCLAIKQTKASLLIFRMLFVGASSTFLAVVEIEDSTTISIRFFSLTVFLFLPPWFLQNCENIDILHLKKVWTDVSVEFEDISSAVFIHFKWTHLHNSLQPGIAFLYPLKTSENL